MSKITSILVLAGIVSLSVSAATLTYGDEDLFGFGYSSDPSNRRFAAPGSVD